MMKKLSLIALLYGLPISSFAQHSNITDSLTDQICHTLQTLQIKNDSILLNYALEKHLYKYIANMSDEVANNAVERVILRLAYRCDKYNSMMRKLEKPGPHWHYVYRLPPSEVSKAHCDSFFKKENYYYIDGENDTTRLQISSEFWIDHMKDNTFSKLSLKRTSTADFEIAFIESNNNIKSKLSIPGDIYQYRIVRKTDSHYELAVTIPGISSIALFNVYWQK
jgi:hypothetical protein